MRALTSLGYLLLLFLFIGCSDVAFGKQTTFRPLQQTEINALLYPSRTHLMTDAQGHRHVVSDHLPEVARSEYYGTDYDDPSCLLECDAKGSDTQAPTDSIFRV